MTGMYSQVGPQGDDYVQIRSLGWSLMIYKERGWLKRHRDRYKWPLPLVT